MKNDGVMPIRRSRKKWQLAYFGPEFGYFGHIFCSSFTLRLISKPNEKSIELKMTIVAPEKPQKWPYLNSRFSKVTVTQSLVTSATINIFYDSPCS